MTKKKTSSQQPHLTAHGLLGSLSYWGTSARVFLVTVVIAAAYLLHVSHLTATEWKAFDLETVYLLFGFFTILITDMGYVVAARSLPLNKVLDRWVVMLSDLLLAGFFVAPSLVMATGAGNKLRLVALVAALLIVSVRILVGLLFAKRK